MDITVINEEIQQLEQEDTTLNNVMELAALYQVRNNLNQKSSDSVKSELDDILPYYIKYRHIKQRYQTNQALDSEVISGIKDVCKELKEFIDILYNTTDMHKERMCIKKLIQELSQQYKD